MTKIYSKINPELLLLTIIKFDEINKKRQDLSPKEEFLQVSCQIFENGSLLRAHKHKEVKRNTNLTQEVWVVIKGKISARFYDLDDKVIHECILKDGDCAITFRAGQSFEIIEDDTIFYEIKNGPYFGEETDREFI